MPIFIILYFFYPINQFFDFSFFITRQIIFTHIVYKIK